MSPRTGPSAIVVGAGIVGAACAEALAEAGCRVTVLEAAFAGSGTTSTAMGHLVVMDDSAAQLAFTSWSRRLWTERAPALPPACEDDACGTLWIATDEEEMAHVRTKAEVYTRPPTASSTPPPSPATCSTGPGPAEPP
jgi:glycine/D-amino acid oxidase-like deaminating enzyme